MTADSPGSRRQLALAVLCCAAGAGLVLFAASRTWLVEEGLRPSPMPPQAIPRSGGDLVPAIPALGIVALAGAAAVLAARGRLRAAVGGLLSFVGLGAVVLLQGVLGSPGLRTGWVAAVVVGGLTVTAAGVLTLRNGARWPGLGARYERAAAAPPGRGAPTGNRPAPPDAAIAVDAVSSERPNPSGDNGGNPGAAPHTAWWDAIDRGEDPTRT